MNRRKKNKYQPRILIVDDKDSESIRDNLPKKYRQNVNLAAKKEKAEQLIEKNTYDLYIFDLNLKDSVGDANDISGLYLAKSVIENKAPTQVIILTAHPSIKSAVELAKIGVADYKLKPWTRQVYKPVDVCEWDEFHQIVEKLLDRTSKTESDRLESIEAIKGKSQQIREIRENIANVWGPSESRVLITGETGTGKGLVVKAIHCNSPFRYGECVSVNCGAIPRELAESELFGHEAGAFTGATYQKIGILERANGGTLFLDQIESLEQALQSKLLTAIEELELTRVGGTKPIQINARIIAASNEDLQTMVDEGKFRGDLHMRLKVIEIKLPPLRERKEDIPLLLDYFLEEECKKQKKEVVIDNEIRTLMEKDDWTGNVRELENFAQRIVVEGGVTTNLRKELQEKIGRFIPTGENNIRLTEGEEDYMKALIDLLVENNLRPVKQSDLGNKVFDNGHSEHRSAVSQAVKGLEDKGLIESRGTAGRYKLVTITENVLLLPLAGKYRKELEQLFSKSNSVRT